MMPTTVKDLMAAARAVVPAITPADAARMVAENDALIVDVRDTSEVAASGKAKGAVAVSRGLLEFRADPDSPNHDPAFRKDRPVILYCGSGGRAALAGKTLHDMGFKDVRNLGGLKDWVAAGQPVEKA
jgi:rhodanese-related sulfurtransferase